MPIAPARASLDRAGALHAADPAALRPAGQRFGPAGTRRLGLAGLHAWVSLGFALFLAVSAALLDRLAAHSSRPGQVWLLSRGMPQAALRTLPAPARVLQAWGGGRLLVLHVDSLRGFRLPPGATWLVLRMPEGTGAWPACA